MISFQKVKIFKQKNFTEIYNKNYQHTVNVLVDKINKLKTRDKTIVFHKSKVMSYNEANGFLVIVSIGYPDGNTNFIK